METKVKIFRMRYFFYFVIFSFFILWFCLFYLQIIRGKYFYQISEKNRRQVYLQRAPRGIIYDRYGRILADNGPLSGLFFSAENLDSETLKGTVKRLSGLLGFEEEKIWQKIKTEERSLVKRLKEGLSREEMFKVEENRTNLPGVNLQIEPRRRYPYGALAGHLLGYLGKINQEELDRLFLEGYRQDDLLGKSGLEHTYDQYLRGEPGGIEIEVDAQRRERRIIRNFSSLLGKNLFLTVDSELQKVCEEELKSRKKNGAIIVLEPQTGEILALVSLPGYDPNLFTGLNNQKEVTRLLSDPQLPLFNRTLQGLYPPGSVFKIITAICALEEKKIDLKEEMFCSGSFSLGKRVFRCWKPEGHGCVSFLSALTHSCDVYFYQLGLRCGVDLLEKYAKKFGLDNLSQIDLPGEKKGLVPGRSWKRKYCASPWYEGDTVNLSIGQGYVLLTPLAAANLAAILANRGKLYRPHLVKKIVDEENNTLLEMQPQEIFALDLKVETWEILNQGLKEAVLQGTGRAASLPGIDIAGKTGTGENPAGGDHAWFIGYAPAENPKIAFAIFVEHGGRGGVAAAPIAQKIVLTALEKKEKETVSFEFNEKESD